MLQFKYTAVDRQGNKRSGIVEAADEKQGKQILREKGVIVTSITPTNKGISFDRISQATSRVSQTEIANFTRQLSTMITAGLSLTESLNILRQQSTSKKFGSILESIVRDIEGGGSFADALTKHKNIFSHVYISLVRAGESSGLLDTILARLAENLEKQREFRAKTKGALIYPIVVLAALAVVIFIMMVFVIPRLTEMYRDMDVELPGPTQFLISMSDFFVEFWWLVIAGTVGSIFAFRRFSKTSYGQRRIDEIAFRIPIFGKIRKEAILTEITRTLGLLISAGIPIIESLNIVSEASGSKIYEDALHEAAKDIEHGYPLSSPITKSALFPPILGQMIRVGEETGKLDEVLIKISKYFEAEVENLVKNLTTALEPFILIMLGLAVAFLVISIILPIYRLTTSF